MKQAEMQRKGSMLKKLARAASVLALSSLLVVVSFIVAMRLHFHPPAPKFDAPPADSALTAQRQDLFYFRQLIALDRSFSPAARAEANRQLDAFESRDTVSDRPHFRVALMQIDALADNGHSRVEGEDSAGARGPPFRVDALADGLYIMRAAKDHLDLLGAKIVAVNGQPIEAVMGKLEQLRGGTHAWRRLQAARYLTMQDILVGLDMTPDPLHSVWTVETAAGEAITRRFDASDESPREWQSFEADRGPPLSLIDFGQPFRSLRLPDSCVQFVQLKSNADVGGHGISSFLSNTEAELRKSPPSSVILDLRYDGGGDYLNTSRFARELPELISPTGRIILLTGPATFSAGISTAVLVKQAGGERVAIVGEAVGDRLQFYSEGGRACLPNSPLCVAYQTGKHDYQHVCRDLADCFWLNYFFPLQVKTLDPDQIVSWSFKDWRAGIDPVLDRALSLVPRDCDLHH
jgi:hypothetical protein